MELAQSELSLNDKTTIAMDYMSKGYWHNPDMWSKDLLIISLGSAVFNRDGWDVPLNPNATKIVASLRNEDSDTTEMTRRWAKKEITLDELLLTPIH